MSHILKLRDDGLLATTNIKEEANILYTNSIVISGSNYLLVEGGNSFPISPTPGTLFYRSDERKYYYYDGTNWLELITTTSNAPEYLGTAWSPFHTNDYFILPPLINNYTLTNLTLTQSIIYLFPVTFSRTVNLRELAIFKTNATTGSLQLGIYSNTLRSSDRTDVPNILQINSTIALSAPTGFYTMKTSYSLHAYETYWFALVTPTANVRIYSISTQYTINFLGIQNASTPTTFYTVIGNSLPSTLVNATFNKNNGNCPIIYGLEG